MIIFAESTHREEASQFGKPLKRLLSGALNLEECIDDNCVRGGGVGV
jgi:hypothetical protein